MRFKICILYLHVKIIIDFYILIWLYVDPDRIGRTVEIQKQNMEIEEKGVRLRLTVVDTPGFGDSVNAEDR